MPRNNSFTTRMESLTKEDRALEGFHYQHHWYNFFQPMTIGQRVLDVGAGDGSGTLSYKTRGTGSVACIDPLPMSDRVKAGFVSEFANKSYDVVMAIDVIEHVEYAAKFFENLCRVAAAKVILTTPNYLFSKCANKFHFFEYSPDELTNLLYKKSCEFYTSDSNLNISKIASLRDAKENFGVVVNL